MKLLHLFQALTGDAASVGIPITGFFIGIFCIFLFGAMKRAQAVGGVWYKQNMAKVLPAIFGFWLICLAGVWSDYRPRKKRDGVAKQQTDTTRISADSMIKLQGK